MAKIFSLPKMPSTPAPAVQKLPDTVNVADITPTEPSEDEIRVENILNRKRGRLGTIATSFNGVLNDTISNAPARKTLLGE